MQLDVTDPRSGPAADIAGAFSQWALAHRSSGGDFDERALEVGMRATLAAYHGGLALSDAFEMGRQAYYATLR